MNPDHGEARGGKTPPSPDFIFFYNGIFVYECTIIDDLVLAESRQNSNCHPFQINTLNKKVSTPFDTGWFLVIPSSTHLDRSTLKRRFEPK